MTFKPASTDTTMGARPASPPWISVLMPAHNAGQHLRATLDSLLGQLSPDAELLVLDDGSTDDTASILDTVQARCNAAPSTSPRLVRLEHPKALGVSASRNRLLEAATGQWLWFIDADDLLRPGAMAKVRQVVDTHAAGPQLDAVVVDHAILRDPPRLKHRLRGEGHRRTLLGKAGAHEDTQALLRGLLAKAQWHPWGRIVRRESWPLGLRFPPGRVFEDLSVVPRLMAGFTQVHYLDEPLIDYRSRPGSILGSMNAAKVGDWALAIFDLAESGSPAHVHWQASTQAAWTGHIALQAVRMLRVAQRLGVPEAQRAAWRSAILSREPRVLNAMRAWAFSPARWPWALAARRQGWLDEQGARR